MKKLLKRLFGHKHKWVLTVGFLSQDTAGHWKILLNYKCRYPFCGYQYAKSSPPLESAGDAFDGTPLHEIPFREYANLDIEVIE